MLKVVLDTNQFVSAVLKPHSNSAIIIDLVYNEKLELLLSYSILDEIRRVIFYPKLTRLHHRNSQWLETFLLKIESIGKLLPDNLKVDFIKSDPTDNKFLACAVEGHADFIVSGDQHLKEVRIFQGIPIVSPDVFLQRVEQEKLFS
ncbi:MAG: putative toxin-antitoxin system toxin component, PIN family [Nitrospirae bacterium]|nr:putative toxin-antitoxin system toxin component, PIN family [Nitrospirota bacterium]